MSLILDGSNGLSDVDGTAATPAIRGTDTNTGIFFPAADTIAFSEGGAEVARIDANGNLGIGNSSPFSNSTYTAMTIGGSKRGLIELKNASNAAPNYLYVDSESGLTLETSTAQAIRFAINSTEYMRLGSNGNVAIGSSSTSGNRLYVVGADSTSNNWSMYAANSSGTAQFGLRNDNYFFAPAIANYPTPGTTVVLQGSYIGYLSSSIRFKKDVVDYDKGLAEVAQLRPVYYRASNPNQDGQYDERTYSGFIAEEVKELGLEEYIDYNQEGEITSLKYAQMTALLCKAIQELKAQVDAQAVEIQALKGAA